MHLSEIAHVWRDPAIFLRKGILHFFKYSEPTDTLLRSKSRFCITYFTAEYWDYYVRKLIFIVVPSADLLHPHVGFSIMSSTSPCDLEKNEVFTVKFEANIKTQIQKKLM